MYGCYRHDSLYYPLLSYGAILIEVILGGNLFRSPFAAIRALDNFDGRLLRKLVFPRTDYRAKL